MAKKVKIGLIGLGFMGSTHFRIHQSNPDAQITALADVDPVKRKGDISAVIGNIGNDDNSKPLDLTNIAVYDDPFKLIAEADVDMVDICVPTPFHAELIVAALKAGKHVFSEKPLCRNLEQMNAIADAVRNSDRFFNAGLCIRAWPEYRHAKELYDSGKFGKVICATFRRLSPTVIGGGAWNNWFCDGKMSGGALLDLHMHDADAINYFFGRPARVTAFGVAGVRCPDAIDHVVAHYDYGNGTVICAEGSWIFERATPFQMTFIIKFEKATVRLGTDGYAIFWADGTTEKPQGASPDAPTGWHVELKYFVDCVKNNVKPDKYQTIDSVLDSFRLIMAEQQSIDEKQTITIKY